MRDEPLPSSPAIAGSAQHCSAPVKGNGPSPSSTDHRREAQPSDRPAQAVAWLVHRLHCRPPIVLTPARHWT